MDAHDALPGGAANLLGHMLHWQTWQSESASAYRAAVWTAAVAALPAACGGAAQHAFGGFGHGMRCSRCVAPAFEICGLLTRTVAATHDAPPACARAKAEISALRSLLQAQPGGLAALVRCMARSAASLPVRARTQYGALLHLLLGSRSDDDKLKTNAGGGAAVGYVPSWLCRSALLDEELCMSELLTLPHVCDAGERQAISLLVAAMEADDVMQARLRHPPAGGRAGVAAAATLALLASRPADALRLLKESDGVLTLARAYVASCCAQQQQQQQVEEPWHEALSRRLYHERLRGALSAIADAAGLHRAPPQLPAPKNAPPTPNGAARLSAKDVNVRRCDSLMLLVGGKPLYVNGMLLEAASPLLADVLASCVEDDDQDGALPPWRPPLVLSPPAGVRPADFHALMCAAVEHTYTGKLPEALPQERLLPLWCVAQHLQFAALAACCAAQLLPAMRARPAALLPDVVRVAARHGSKALMHRAASVLLSSAGGALSDASDALVAEAAMNDDDARGGMCATTGEQLAEARRYLIQRGLPPPAD